jgi:valyl-tRNA synthetase
MDVVHSVRSLRAKFNLTKERPQLFINLHNEEFAPAIAELRDTITFLSQSGSAEMLLNKQPPEGCAVEIVNESMEVYLMIKGLVDIAAEVKKLEEKKGKLQAEFDKLKKQTEGPNWAKVPEKVKADNAARVRCVQYRICFRPSERNVLLRFSYRETQLLKRLQ